MRSSPVHSKRFLNNLRTTWFEARRALSVSLSFLTATVILSACFANRQIVINTSGSVAPGLYVRSIASPAIGQLVEFLIPASARGYVLTRTGQSGDDWYILKPIVAGPGDTIDSTGAWLIINGRQVAPMPPARDAAGRNLPIWHECRRLSSDEFFVFSSRIPNSFDSRCYGPIRREQIVSVRKPLLTW